MPALEHGTERRPVDARRRGDRGHASTGTGDHDGARLILDTGVIIAGVRGHLDIAAFGDNDDVAIPAVVVAEYLAGTLLDPDPGRSVARRAFLDEVLQVLPVHEYDRDVAEHHAALLAYVLRAGSKTGSHDLIVAATARAADRIVLTTDERAGFGELPDVSARLVTT